jgi:hypothetical protein
VRCIAWHPYKQTVAVALCDDTVRLYDLVDVDLSSEANADVGGMGGMGSFGDGVGGDVGQGGGSDVMSEQARGWRDLRLRHDFQRGIRALAWKPLSGGVLAVACDGGICLWKVFGSSCAWMRLLQDECGPILSLAWSPCGTFLASAAANSSVVSVWSPSLASADPRRLTREPLNVWRARSAKLLKWSDTGYYLFAGTSTDSICVWETRTWRCETWSSEGGPCRAATWSADGRVLLLASENSSAVHGLIFDFCPPRIDARFVPFAFRTDEMASGAAGARAGGVENRANEASDPANADPAEAASTVEESCSKTTRSERAGDSEGVIRQVVLDPLGERIAVSHEGRSEVALYNANLSRGRMTFNPRRPIRPPATTPDACPVAIEWMPQCLRGALLCVVWDTGVVAFYPMHFEPACFVDANATGLDWAAGAPVPSRFMAPHLSYRYQRAKESLRQHY